MRLKCKNLTFGYKDKQILNNVNIELEDNEIKLIYGPIGMGKSTLVYLLSGLEENYSGEILWGDEDISKLGKKIDKKRNELISVNFSNFYYIRDLSVEENIIFPALFKGSSKNTTDKRLSKIYEAFKDIEVSENNFFTLADFKDKPLQTLSNGQREVAMMARMLINDTPFILADEMLRSFNGSIKGKIWRILRDEFDIGKTRGMLMITHDDTLSHVDNSDKFDGITEVYDLKYKKFELRS